MGLSPIVPVFRFTVPIVSLTHNHKVRGYMDGVPSSDPTGFDWVARSGFSNVPGTVGLERIAVALSHLYAATTASFGSILVEQRVGTSYVPVATYAPTATPAAPVSNFDGSLATALFRTTTFERVPVPISEGDSGSVAKYISYSALQPNQKAFVNAYTNAGTTATTDDPYVWVRGRAGAFIGSFQSYVQTYGRKQRKKAGLL